MTYDVSAWVRVIAAVGAVAFIAAPAVAALVAKAKAWKPRPVEGPTEKASVTERDMHTVLDLAARLNASGCTEGVALCQQLIDVMLGGTSKAKK